MSCLSVAMKSIPALLFPSSQTGNNKDGIKFACGLQLRSLNIYETRFYLYFFPLPLPFFFVLDRAQPETLQWRRRYLSVPVRHSIRTDGSSVIKMTLRYNGEDEDARERVLASVFAVGARRFHRVMNARSLLDALPFDGNGLLITTIHDNLCTPSRDNERCRSTKQSRNEMNIDMSRGC